MATKYRSNDGGLQAVLFELSRIRPQHSLSLATVGLLSALAVAGCGPKPGGSTSESETDTVELVDGLVDTEQPVDVPGQDVPLDATADLTGDIQTDLAPDAANDASTDAGEDAGEDVAPDVGPDASAQTGALTIQVVGPDGLAIAAAKVDVAGNNTPVGVGGVANFPSLPVGSTLAVVTAPGFAPASRTLTVTAGGTVSVTIALTAVASTQVVLADVATTVTGADVAVVLPAGAFVQANGTAVTGPVDLTIAPLDPSQQSLGGAPGALVGTATGKTTPELLDAMFLADVSFSQGGKAISLAPGKTATLTFTLPSALAGSVAVGQQLGAWYYDLPSATWKQDGSGTVGTDGAGNKTFTVTVSHFTWWMGAVPVLSSGCLKVSVTEGGQPKAGVGVQAEGVSYNGISVAQTGADGSACVETSINATVRVSVAAAGVVQIGGPVQVVSSSTLATCGPLDGGCLPVPVTVAAPTACAANAALCDDKNACTTDGCDVPNNTCVHSFTNFTACDDGIECTTADECLSGGCVGKEVSCVDSDPCTVDACAEGSGCTHTPGDISCDDGNACTENDKCTAGTCGGTAIGCDDQNPCTSDACAAGVCTHTPLNGSCDDGDACTAGDACANGTCAGATKACDDQNPCTDDTCSGAGVCGHTNSASPCDDGNACTFGDMCKLGACIGDGLVCDDANTCTTDGCDPAVGCTTTPVADNAPCTFGDACSTSHVCQSGSCLLPGSVNTPAGMTIIPPGSFLMGCVASVCPDPNVAGLGASPFEVPRHKVTLSAYYLDITETTVAQYKACVTAGVCSAPNSGLDPTTDGQCNWGASGKDDHPVNCVKWTQAAKYCAWKGGRLPTEAEWERAARGGQVGNVYPWGDAMPPPLGTENLDTCADGFCETAPVGSFPANAFGLKDIGGNVSEFVADWYDVDYYKSSPLLNPKGPLMESPVGGYAGKVFRGGKWRLYMNFNVARASGRPSDDNDQPKADLGFRCARSFPTAVLSCDDDNPCTVDSCGATGICAHTPATLGCDDGDPCTTADVCQAGACTSGAATNCDDGNTCTVDACEALLGCTHISTTGATCDDGNACTSADACDTGTCTGVSKVCDDKNVCTQDSCLAATGNCVNAAAAGDCDVDGSICTVDACQNGVCTTQGQKDCTDDNDCTVDACDTAGNKCTHKAVTAGSACVPKDGCMLDGQCQGTSCSGTKFKDCDDLNVCTTDSCDATTGNCLHAAAAGACDVDNSKCTPDTCNAGSCQAAAAINCDDNFKCTVDSCDPTTGECKYAPDTAVCDDGDICTQDKCDAIGCHNKLIDGKACDLDGNWCTWDACQADVCVATGQATFCDDGNPCTIDSCVAPTGCQHHAVTDGTSCTDGNACTVGDNCVGGYCKTTLTVCTPGEVCVVGSCATPSAAGLSLIPGGTVQIGCVAGDSACEASEKPQYDKKIESFLSGTNEVTITEFKACVTAGYCTSPDTTSGQCAWGVVGKEQDPVDCVNVMQADAYCTWAGGHLPSEEQWEAAARGGLSGKLYPWGDATADCSHAVTPACGGTPTLAVGSKPAGKNGYGLNDAAGNVAEWTSSSYTQDYVTFITSLTTRVVRGGGGTDTDLRVSHRGQQKLDAALPGLGFRCMWVVQATQFCDDGIMCTIDAIDATGACVHTQGTICNDGLPCTNDDTCVGSTCVGTPTTCDDGNACTTDTCDPVTGCALVKHPKLPDGTPCEADTSACTNDICNYGYCVSGSYKDCDDGNVCTENGCDPATGACDNKPYNGVLLCTDGNACTMGDSCAAGACEPGPAANCNDGLVCTSDSCAPASGCKHTLAIGVACDLDNDLCTLDQCGSTQSGQHICYNLTGAKKDCDDKEACTTDACDPLTGQCSHSVLPDTAPCTDGDACTTDKCAAGVCKSTAVVCANGTVCQWGDCVGTPPDGMAYIPGGTFEMGADTLPGNPPIPQSPKHTVTVDGFYMDIYEVTAAKYQACVTANACGAPSKKVDANLGLSANAYTTGHENYPSNRMFQNDATDYCKWAGGRLPTEAEWEHAAQAPFVTPVGGNVAWCDLAVAAVQPWSTDVSCNGTTTMAVGFKPLARNIYGIYDLAGNVAEWVMDWYTANYYTLSPANNPEGPNGGKYRTARGGTFVTNFDSIQIGAGWIHGRPELQGMYNPNWPDNVGSLYIGFRCVKPVPGTDAACLDGNQCTTDTFVNGQCVHTNNTLPCDDGIICTDDTCANGVCVTGPHNCDDGIECTFDYCDQQANACAHNGKMGDVCGSGAQDACDGAKCDGALKCTPFHVNCDDNDPCTLDVCNTSSGGCSHQAQVSGGACNDGDACTTGDVCTNGKCAGSAVTCTGGMECHNGTCQAPVSEWATVPASTFKMGCVPGDANCDSYEKPQHDVVQYVFEIGTHEVTVAQYAACVTAGACAVPNIAYCEYTEYATWGVTGKAQHPINCTTWKEAEAYCTWAGARLPSEAEWERSVRGGLVDKIYAWGDALPPPASAGNLADQTLMTCDPSLPSVADYTDGYCGTAPVTHYSANPLGIYDMTGNVAEIVADIQVSYPVGPVTNPKGGSAASNDRAARGSNFLLANSTYSGLPNLRASERSGQSLGLSDRYATIGFRCARSIPGTPGYCDDNEVCTTDTWDAGTQKCVHAPAAGACDDGKACTTNDTCSNGACAGTVACDDGNACTTDICQNSGCYHPSTAGNCDMDGTACTADLCSNGYCYAGLVQTCDDKNACTTDSCNTTTGACTHANIAEGGACTDGSLCTTGDTCKSGVCSGVAVACDVGQACQNGTCAAAVPAGMTFIPAGTFNMGCVPNDPLCTGNWAHDDLPRHSVTVDAFALDTSEVTVARYSACVTAGGCTAADVNGMDCNGGVPGAEQQPINCVTWTQADAFCTWSGGRLPTEAEWEHAGRADLDGKRYPWGDSIDCTFAVYSQSLAGAGIAGCDGKSTALVATHPLGKNAYGLNDMAGNVAEWVKDWYGFSYYTGSPLKNPLGPTTGTERVVRGGSYMTSMPEVLRVSDRDATDPSYSYSTIGFRCARTLAVPTGSCDDLNPCTTDSGTVGQCTHVAVTGVCDDNDKCTTNDACSGGFCTGTAVNCTDSNPCTTDTCSTVVGCQHSNLVGACDLDGTACTPDTCANGLCVAGTALNCDDKETCTTDSCNPQTGCVHVNAANGAACTDGTNCTTGDACASGKCTGTVKVCNDGNPCTTDSCNATTGCVFTQSYDVCDLDGTVCTPDYCMLGTCVAGTKISCDDNLVCTTDTCDAILGCQHVNMANGAACTDGDPCTTGDGCSGTQCKGNAVVCGLGQTCQAGVCAAEKFCGHSKCTAGVMLDATCDPCVQKICAVDTFCCNNTWDPSCVAAVSSVCGITCTACTPNCTGKLCGSDGCGGWCGSAPVNCDDKNACTDDGCQALIGCSHAANTVPTCDDGSACTVNDVCSGGVCAGTVSVQACDDGNACTADSCAAGACKHDPTINTPCNADDKPCTEDYCYYSNCYTGYPKNCDDSDNCTTDSCNAATGACEHSDAADGGWCDDGNYCTSSDVCTAGKCKGPVATCEDSNSCTQDACDAAGSTCTHDPIAGACDYDSNPCTLNQCDAGACQWAPTKPCDDSNPCTTDSCDTASGDCVFEKLADTNWCEDGNACTSNDSCVNGVCEPGGALSCEDYNACTTDACDAVSGCQHVDVTCVEGECTTSQCDAYTGCAKPDGTACGTAAATCVAGVCMP